MAAIPQVPAGSGAHPVVLVVLSSRDLDASCAFYTRVFGWALGRLPGDLAVCPTPSGPGIAVRAGLPEGFPSAVPFLVDGPQPQGEIEEQENGRRRGQEGRPECVQEGPGSQSKPVPKIALQGRQAGSDCDDDELSGAGRHFPE